MFALRSKNCGGDGSIRENVTRRDGDCNRLTFLSHDVVCGTVRLTALTAWSKWICLHFWLLFLNWCVFQDHRGSKPVPHLHREFHFAVFGAVVFPLINKCVSIASDLYGSMQVFTPPI